MSLRKDEHAVTPVIGTVLVLGISVAGIAAILFWGAPAIQGVQDASAQQAVLNDFAAARQAMLGLTVVDAAVDVSLQSPAGTVGLGRGTSMLVSANTAEGTWGADCSIAEVTGWSGDPLPAAGLDAEFGGACALSAIVAFGNQPDGSCVQIAPPDEPCARLFRLAGATPVPTPWTAGTTVASQTNDWMIQLDDGSPSQVVLAQAFIFNTDALEWGVNNAGARGLALEHGAVFSQSPSGIFLEAPAVIQEQRFDDEDYLLRVLDLDTANAESYSGRNNLRLQLALSGQSTRTSDDVWSLDFEWSGLRAGDWCRAMDLRDPLVLGLDQANGRYTPDPAADCASATPRIQYSFDDDADSAPDMFPFTLLHATYRADLAI